MFGLIFPSEELLDFVKHDFKTKEDRKHTQNINYSRTGIIIAILLGLFGLWNPFQKSQPKENENLNLIISKIDSLISIENETLINIKNKAYNTKLDSTEIAKKKY